MALKKVLAAELHIASGTHIFETIQDFYPEWTTEEYFVYDCLTKAIKKVSEVSDWDDSIIELTLQKDKAPGIDTILNHNSILSKLNEDLFNKLASIRGSLPFKTSDATLHDLILEIKHDNDDKMERMLSIATAKNGDLYVGLSAKSEDDIAAHDNDLNKIRETMTSKFPGRSIIFCQTSTDAIPFYREGKSANGRLCSEMSILKELPIENVSTMVTAWVGRAPKMRYAPLASDEPLTVLSSPQRYIKPFQSVDLALASNCPGCMRSMSLMARTIKKSNI